MNNIDLTRERVFHFFSENRSLGNKHTLEHFLAEGVARSTIYDAIQRVKNKIGPQRRKDQGRTARKMPKKAVKRLARYFNHKQGKSQTIATRKFGITQQYVFQLLKKEKVKCLKKKTIPDRTEEQAKAAKTKCRQLYEKYCGREWILDD